VCAFAVECRHVLTGSFHLTLLSVQVTSGQALIDMMTFHTLPSSLSCTHTHKRTHTQTQHTHTPTALPSPQLVFHAVPLLRQLALVLGGHKVVLLTLQPLLPLREKGLSLL
jgi:hypothetical protein